MNTASWASQEESQRVGPNTLKYAIPFGYNIVVRDIPQAATVSRVSQWLLDGNRTVGNPALASTHVDVCVGGRAALGHQLAIFAVQTELAATPLFELRFRWCCHVPAYVDSGFGGMPRSSGGMASAATEAETGSGASRTIPRASMCRPWVKSRKVGILALERIIQASHHHKVLLHNLASQASVHSLPSQGSLASLCNPHSLHRHSRQASLLIFHRFKSPRRLAAPRLIGGGPQ